MHRCGRGRGRTMTETGPPAPGKFIRFFRLVDACDRPGCPVCRCLVADARQYLDSLLYERVNDPDTRRRLHASWGFCSWHAWMLREVSDPAFGSAIMYEDFLRAAIQRFEHKANQLVKSPRGLLGWPTSAPSGTGASPGSGASSSAGEHLLHSPGARAGRARAGVGLGVPAAAPARGGDAAARRRARWRD